MHNKSILMTTAYFAPAQYYCKLIEHPEIIIEKFENYSKQTYRNRCHILGANGILQLTIPIEKASRKKILTKDVLIAYHTDWQKLHWKGIESAYKSSPYYEYYIDELSSFFSKRWKYLFEFNQNIQQEICQILEIEPQIKYTEDYIMHSQNDQIDYRDAIHPKPSKAIADPHFKAQEYTQVFSDRHQFSPNLSILDVIFNLGPESVDYLESCIKLDN